MKEIYLILRNFFPSVKISDVKTPNARIKQNSLHGYVITLIVEVHVFCQQKAREPSPEVKEAGAEGQDDEEEEEEEMDRDMAGQNGMEAETPEGSCS